MLTERRRAYIYRVLLAASVVAVAYGWATDAQVATWLPLVAAILGNGLAAGHTSTN